MRRLIFVCLAFCLLAAAPAGAQLTIEIVGGAGTTVPIAIVPFENESSWPLGITGIVAADLQRSGLFKMVSDAGIVPRPSRAEDVKYADFRARGADAVVVGSMRPLADGRVDVRFALLDAVKQAQLAAITYVVAPAQFRVTAHKIADVIYEKLTGDAGVFSTRIAYITKQGHALRADRRRRRRRQSAGSRRLERAAALAVVVAGWNPARVRFDGEQEARHLHPIDGHRRAAGDRQFPRQQQRAGVVARWSAPRSHA